MDITARTMAEAGLSATEIRDRLNITYANASYYVRKYGKSTKFDIAEEVTVTTEPTEVAVAA